MCKRISWILFFFTCILSSQAQKNLPETGNCTITVLVKNPIQKEITVDINTISLAARPVIPNQKRILLDEKNKAFLKIPLKGPTILKLMNLWPDSSVSYIAIPGVDIIIHLDLLGKDTANYADVGPAETDFYLNVLAKSREILKAIPQEDPEQFLKIWDHEFNAMQELIKATSVSRFSPAYITWISQSVRSLFQSQLSRQLTTYVTITRRWPSNIKEYESRINTFTSAQFNQPGFFTRETDRELVESYYLFSSLIKDWKNKQPAPNAESVFRNAISLAREIRSETSRDLMYRYLVTQVTAQTTDINFLKWVKGAIVINNQTKHLGKLITDKQNLLQKIGKDKPAPYFEATNLSGKKFSYQDFHGKYLFIDIWATWCVPCRKEIPYLEELKQKYAGQPIEFISVSTDEKLSAWKKFVELIENKDQFHSMPRTTSSVNEVFHADLIPAFVLIDPESKIVNPTSFRPSDPALGLLLDELLKKNNNSQSIQ